MTGIKQKLSGVFAPVVTPFERDELLLDCLRDNLKKLAKTDLTGYFALGSNGEFRSLSEREELQVLEVFSKEKSEKVVIVGTSCESSRQTILKTKRAAEMGFPFVGVLTPSYFAGQINDKTLTDYYTRIADNSIIPILLYNAPKFAGGVSISPACLNTLAEHPNIVGIKDSSSIGPGGFLSQLDPSNEFYVLAGSINIFYPSLHLGAVGGILSLANSFPEVCCRLYSLFLEGTYEDALDLHGRLVRINRNISGAFGVAGVKAAMDIAGFHGGEPRHPLRPLSDSEKEEIRRIIEKEGINVGE